MVTKSRLILALLVLAAVVVAGGPPVQSRRLHHRSTAWTPPAGLVAWWYGDSQTGGQWTDRSGNANHGVLYGAPSLTADGVVITKASSQYVQTGDACGLPDLPITLCCWFAKAEIASCGSVLGFGGYSASRGASIGYGSTTMDSNGDNFLAVNAYRAWLTPSPAQAIGADWHHLAVTYSLAGAYVLYLDGTSVGSGTSALHSTALEASPGLRIGANTAAAPRYPDGTVDDVMLFNSALTQPQIADIMANSPGRH